MATRSNPYAMDPFLQQGISNLTRALIGSAQDDASIAAANASNSRAGYYDAQTAGQNAQNAYLDNAMSGIDAAMGDSNLVRSMFNTFGLQGNNPDTNPTGKAGPFIGNNPNTSLAPTAYDQDAVAGLVRSMFFGGVPGTPNQSAAAGQTLADMANRQAAYNLLANSGQSPDRQAAIRLGMNPGKFFDQGFAQQELQTNDATNRRGQDIASGDNRYESDMRFGVGGQGDRDTAADNAQLNQNNIRDNRTTVDTNNADNAAQTAWERYKADRQLEGKKYDVDSRDQTARDVKDKDVAFEQWKHNNRDLEITVEPGQRIVLNPAAGQILGVQPNDQGLYVLDGGFKPGSLVVKVGKEDVYLTEEDAARLGIVKNNDGQFVIPGKPELAPKNSSGGSSSSSSSGGGQANDILNSNRFQEAFAKSVENFGDPEMPRHVYGGIQIAGSAAIARAMAENPNLTFQQAYTENVIPMINAGTIEITEGVPNFMFPRYFYNYFVANRNAPDNQVMQFIMNDLNYDSKKAGKILRQIKKARG